MLFAWWHSHLNEVVWPLFRARATGRPAQSTIRAKSAAVIDGPAKAEEPCDALHEMRRLAPGTFMVLPPTASCRARSPTVATKNRSLSITRSLYHSLLLTRIRNAAGKVDFTNLTIFPVP